MATVVADHKQIDKRTTIRSRKENPQKPSGTKTEVPPGDGQKWKYWGLQLVCGRPSWKVSTVSFRRYYTDKSRKENPQKLFQFGPRSHPRHLLGKRTAQKDAIKQITSNSQVNSCFPYRWSPACLTIYIYFYLFWVLHITRITIVTAHHIIYH